MKQSILISALLGWATAAAAAITLVLIGKGFSSGLAWLAALLYVVIWTGISAFPACLMGGFLATRYLPGSSSWWKPNKAAFLGGACGFLMIGMLGALFSGSPEMLWSGAWYLRLVAAATGAVCGLSLGLFKQKSPGLAAPSPIP